MLRQLEAKDGFIKWTRESRTIEGEQWFELSNSVQLGVLDIGVVEIKPAIRSRKYVVVSCGIHGNETAPIEIVSSLISDIVKLNFEPKVNLLFVIGNPESMKVSQRFVSINMNRLFSGAYKKYDKDDVNCYELERAVRLEKLVSQFFQTSKLSEKVHLDLHTAIKPSFHKTFAIRPLNQEPLSSSSKRLLIAMGIEAVLHNNKATTTFAHYTAETFSAESYTLELGKVNGFGENNLDDFEKASTCLINLITNRTLYSRKDCHLIEYKVVKDIIRQSDDFKFFVPDDVENFTAFSQGQIIAEDDGYNYAVACKKEHVVFPNINVPVGQRVAMMVARV